LSDNLLYLDTNLWNRMLDQGVSPTSVIAKLRLHGTKIAVSHQTIYELQKTFGADRQRGQHLFRYLKECLDVGVVGVLDVMEQLDRETTAISSHAPIIESTYGSAELEELTAEVHKLAGGDFDERCEVFVRSRLEFARSARLGTKTHFDTKAAIKDRLRSVPKDELASWMVSEALSEKGVALLVTHLLRLYGTSLSEEHAAVVAQMLLRNPRFRAARGLVHADLYTNWRFAHRESLRRDLVDDMYHVLNALYCSVYATAEANQANYVHLLLSPATRVAIYDERQSIETWLAALA
jgi:hypothetical protein